MNQMIKNMTKTLVLARNYAVIPGLLLLGALIGTLLPAAAFADSGEHKGITMPRVEVAFTGNGSALVRGAKVTGISGSTFTAQALIGSTTASFTVTTGSSTEFVNYHGKKGSLADIVTGDVVSFRGMTAPGSLFTVNARVVKDWSSLSNNDKKSFRGDIQSIATSTQTFAMSTDSLGTITVKLASSTVISDGGSLLFSNLVVGDDVKVEGSYDSGSKTLTATKITVKHDDDDESFSSSWKLWKDKLKFHLNVKSKKSD